MQKSLRTTGLEQGFSKFWCYGAHEEIDHNLRSPTINSKNKNKKNTLLLSQRIARGASRFPRGALGLLTEIFESLSSRGLYFVLLGKWQLKNGIYTPCVHWMDCACLFHTLCGYYNKGVYIRLIRSTTRRYCWERKIGSAWKCIYPKNKAAKNARNLGNLTKGNSELHKWAINSKKTSHYHLL